jgi:hypothetical protein
MVVLLNIRGNCLCLGSYTLLVNDELIFLTSHIFQAQIQVVCSSIEEAITENDTGGEVKPISCHLLHNPLESRSASLFRRFPVEPMRKLNEVHRSSDGSMGEMGFGQAQIA